MKINRNRLHRQLKRTTYHSDTTAMIVDRIVADFRVRGKERRPPRIGAWNIGRCVRALWYGEHGYPAEEFQARALMVFDLGDRVEDAILAFLEAAKIPNIRTNESRDLVHMPELGCRVRADFFFQWDLGTSLWAERELGEMIYVPSDERLPKPGDIVVGEIKSMSDYAFARAQRGDIDSAYLAQVECYMRAYNCRHALIIAYRKETSHLAEILIGRDDARWAVCIENAMQARAKEPPARPFALEERCEDCEGTGLTAVRKSPHKACVGTGKIPGGPYIPNFPCGYCAFKKPCWGSLELTFRNGHPRWRLKDDTL